MDQSPDYPPQPPPYPQPAPVTVAYAARPMPPQVVHIVARPGGFSRAVGIVIGLFAFLAVLVVGIVIGAAIFFGASQMQTVVLEEQYRPAAFSSDTIAIIPVEGVIDEEQAAFVHAAVEHVLNDDAVRAVVLRVDSPGGGVTASDEIWYEVQRIKKAGLPVIASYGGVAASGGYYVSCGADRIVAEQTCITGSIGVIGQFFTVPELLNKIGVQPVTLVASESPLKDVGNNPFRAWTPADQEKWLTVMNAAYDAFHSRVAAGRKSVITDPASLDAIADGSIYTAQQARDNGLIDAIGYLDDALADAEKAAAIRVGSAHVVKLHRPPSFFGGGLELHQQAAKGAAFSLDADAVRNLVNELTSPRLMYLMQ
jgi:protease-4